MSYTIIAENEKNDKTIIKNISYSQISLELNILNHKYNDIKKIEIIKEN